MNELLLRRRKMAEEGEIPYLRFTALEDNSSVAFGVRAGTPNAYTLEYRKNGGTWIEYVTEDIINIDEEEYIEFRKLGTAVTQLNKASNAGYKFKMTGKIEISGKLVSLLDKSMNVINAGNYCFHSLFISETSIITAENLIFPASTVGYSYVYVAMFSGCSSMVLPPNEFAPLTLGTYACQNMFLNCTSLIKATEIKATYLGTGSLRTMFQGCTSMIDGGDEILAANGTECCSGTFMGCTKLEKAPYFKATTLGNSCYSNLFRGTVNYVTLYHFASLNTSSLPFSGSSHADTFIIDAVTPPTIGSNTLTGLKSTCIIYVPDASVNDYKAAQYWSARADYIKGISEKPTT